MSALNFKILKKENNCQARLGLIETCHGVIETPYFIPVSTLGSLRSLDARDMDELGVQCSLCNTYHLHLRPGDELVKKMGGIHKFMNFPRPLFSDSGGFQAFSLGFAREHNIGKIGFFPGEKKKGEKAEEKEEPIIENSGKNLTKISDEGIQFKSIYDGSWHFFDAKKSMEIQSNLGTDIIMAFDECTSPFSDYEYTKKSMDRTHDWAKKSLECHDKKQALYGIIQGGCFEDLRYESTKLISSLDCEGIAIGGSLGNCKADMHKILEWIVPKLDGRPRHLLGIGDIDDLFECVERGIDTFDCVSPTRNARRGGLFVLPQSGGSIENKFRINIGAEKYKEDSNPIDPACNCPTCRNYSRAYLRHLITVGELSYYRLASIHNIHFMLRLMESIRESLKNGTFAGLKKQWLGKM
ncbi:MAG: tRNA guanosine(34) transglycosylase Tgt [Candidatus Paceibacterota bacterium]|jgi:tRNA-guanine transglycosylase